MSSPTSLPPEPHPATDPDGRLNADPAADADDAAPHTARPAAPPTVSQRVAAWSVHVLTLSGLLWAVLAMLALIDRDATSMWLWLGIALLVDGVDGTLARAARVKEVIPWFDGGVVDIVVDYLTWTFIPAMFLLVALPVGPRPLAAVLTVLILASSMFCYANIGWKSSDNYFVGFPAAWNIVVLVMYLMGTGAVLNTIVVVVLSVAAVIPLHYTHPFRVRHLMIPNLVAFAAWIVGSVWLVATMPVQPLPALILFFVGGIWLLLTGVLRTILGAHRG